MPGSSFLHARSLIRKESVINFLRSTAKKCNPETAIHELHEGEEGSTVAHLQHLFGASAVSIPSTGLLPSCLNSPQIAAPRERCRKSGILGRSIMHRIYHQGGSRLAGSSGSLCEG